MESLADFGLIFEKQLFFLLATWNRTLRLENLLAFGLISENRLFFLLALIEDKTLSRGSLVIFEPIFEDQLLFPFVFTFTHDQL